MNDDIKVLHANELDLISGGANPLVKLAVDVLKEVVVTAVTDVVLGGDCHPFVSGGCTIGGTPIKY